MSDLNVRRETAVQVIDKAGRLIERNGDSITIRRTDGTPEVQYLPEELSANMLKHLSQCCDIPRHAFYDADKNSLN